MIKECNIIYDSNNLPKINVLRTYRTSPSEGDSMLPKLKYINEKIKLSDLAYEQIYVISHNMNGDIKAFMCIGSGDYDHCDIFYRNIGMFLLLSGAEGATLIHNHPEDVREQSEDDIEITNEFNDLCDMFNIKSNGSYIFTHSGVTEIPYESFYDWRMIK